MSELSKGAKSARLWLFVMVIAVFSVLPITLPAYADPQEPVRTTAGSLPQGDAKREAKLTVSAPIMTPEQRIKFYLTWGGAFAAMFALIAVLVLWIFFNTRKDIEDEEEEEDDDDAPPTASPSMQKTTHTLPAATEEGATEPAANVESANAAEAVGEQSTVASDSAKADEPKTSEATASSEA